MLKVVAAAFFAAQVLPPTWHLVEWHKVTTGAYSYLMPPAGCLVRSPPWPGRIIYAELPQTQLDKLMPAAGWDHTFGAYLNPRTWSNPFNLPIIYVLADLPEPVKYDVTDHELAHLNGCEHD